MGRSWLLLFLLLATIFNELLLSRVVVQAWPSLALNDLSPPPGNSLQLKAKTYNGRQAYGCFHGKWKLLNATALLVDATNTSMLVGSYYFQKGTHSAGTWSLTNTPAEYVESGYALSDVSGMEIVAEEAGDGCSNVLAEATNHRYLGRASQISYIQRLSAKFGLPPRSKCRRGSKTRLVPFKAEYWLWSQDTVPPADTPAELLVSKGRLVEGFFGKGVVPYVFNGTSWEQGEWSAMLYDVPGGNLVGQHYMAPVKPGENSSSLVWQIFNPNGWGVSSNATSQPPVQVADNCMAWSLNLVTSSWGNVSLLGPFTHVQMLSTRGGMPPATDATPLLPSAPQPARGDVYKSTFSAVFWFYARPLL